MPPLVIGRGTNFEVEIREKINIDRDDLVLEEQTDRLGHRLETL